MSRWLTFLPLVVLLGLGVLFATFGLHHNPQVQPKAMVGKPVPDLALPSLDDGTPVKLREIAGGKPVIVNFFASWCAPCEIEAPVLMQMKAQGVRMVGIAYKDAPANTQGFLNRLGDPFAQRLVDRDGAAGIEFGVTGVPETYLVGADGVILDKHTGPLEAADAKALAARMLTSR
ncbi:DsbE family thiol:disulfide interchange protein [Phenylobacterium soli]|uniref:DsbE family thiol:disulfide interchange protein n=1 Tax=Phenylobacterium soli TaxID=2170551 RepID=A0A328AFP9_9CAUL|nr:DsbE family thiol:disulfide interchange protein [Phenylobacterium soli]RAK53693.1 DsbE family thiol:disulfide interchange protein [Phenylobacterium soli]